MKSARESPWPLPAILFLTSASALILALTHGGIWDVLSWIALAAPPAICIGAWFRQRRKM